MVQTQIGEDRGPVDMAWIGPNMTAQRWGVAPLGPDLYTGTAGIALVERHHPGKKKSGRQVSFSTDLIYDVLRRYEPGHLLLRAAWDDARARMTELGRLVRLVDRASETMLHVELERISPMAVPLMVIVGREALPAAL